jgi:ATP-dependent exoDNAse (exonuclease V) alpha subunit
MKQDIALDILKRGHNVFLTGPAGSGKTFLLNAYIDHLKQNHISHAVTASTGIAATHIGGRTIHSWSGIGIKEDLSEKEIKKIIKNPLVYKRLTKTNVLIIDEISMLHAYQIDLINKILRTARKNAKPFGGMQIILSGDFFQLPPVRKNAGTTVQLIDQSQSWKEMDLKICYLSEQYRQKENALSRVLSDIRGKCVTEKTHHLLKKSTNQKVHGTQECTKIFTHNIDVDRVNDHELHKIKGKSLLYRMVSDGNEKLVEAIKNGCLAPEELILKKGALVMFVRNNFDQGYVNGTIGTVIDFDADRFPIVETLHGEKITVTPEKWLIEEDGEELAQIKQLPLRLAWAITIHKSQGMTLDVAEIDLKKCFEYGMGYVALSRVRALRDIRLLGINDIALQVDPIIFEKDHVFQNISAKIEQEEMNKKKVLINAEPNEKITSPSEKKTHQNSQNMHPHADKPWKSEDDNKLLACIKKHKSIKTIAKIFGRREGAIRSRIKKITPK